MKAFIQIALFLASAAAVVATNIVTFQSLDNITRTVIFTPNAGLPEVKPVTVPGGHNVSVEFPEGWIGNCYAVQKGGDKNKPGMLCEIMFQGWNGCTYFDVSAIVNPNDLDNVREMYPKGSPSPVSGCPSFPCDHAYYHPDDVQTQSTPETELICTLGANGLSSLSNLSKREERPPVGRNYVLGKF